MKLTLPLRRLTALKYVSVLILFVTFYSCERDEIAREEIEKVGSFKVKTMTHKEASSNQSLLSSFDLATKSLNSAQAKSGVYTDTINNIQILTDKVKHVSTGAYESYTYGVVKVDESNNFYNLLFSKQVDDSFKSFLVTYDMGKVTMDQLRSGELADVEQSYVSFVEITTSFSAKLEVFEIGSGDCFGSVQVYENECGQGGHHEVGEHCPALGRTVEQGEKVVIIKREECESTSGGVGYVPGDNDQQQPPGEDLGIPDGSGTGSGVGAGGDPSDGDDGSQDCLLDNAGNCIGDTTAVVLPTFPVVSIFTNDFLETLENDEKNYINNPDQLVLKLKIDAFLIEEGHSEQAKGFAKEAIKAKMEDKDAEVDFEDPFANMDLSVERALFQQGFRDRMSAAELVIFDEMPIGDQIDYLGSAFMAEQYMEYYYDNTGDYGFYNGIGDAFRHTYWNASATWKLGSEKVKELTDAHEDRVPNPDNPFEYKEVEMDLYNNQRGREIGNSTNFMLFQRVKWSVDNGLGVYLNNRNPLNNRATTDSQLIPTKK